jgi:hypothetical protein
MPVTTSAPLFRGLNDFGFAPVQQSERQWAFVSGSLIRAYVAYVAVTRGNGEEPLELMQWLGEARVQVANATMN